MLYQFPPLTWFESGTISHILLVIGMWVLIASILGSVLGCWYFKPRSRIIWVLAETLWVLASFLLFPLTLGFVPNAMMMRDVPAYLSFTFFVVLLFVPVPAAVAGFNELVPNPSGSQGFRSGCIWACAIPLAIGLFFLMTIIADDHSSRGPYQSICKNSLKQIGLAFHNYLDRDGTFPNSQFASENAPARSWRVELLPYMDQHQRHITYDQTRTWNSDANSSVATQQIWGYHCPAVPAPYEKDTQGRWNTAFATVNGPNSAFPNGKGLTPKDIPDGLSNTVLVTEACGQQIVWTEPRDIALTATNIGVNLPGDKPHQSAGIWSSYHRGVGRNGEAHTLFGDGSVRALNVDTDPQVLRAITTRNGGEEVGVF